jgi:nucleoside-diphosphate-sugar epimerase
MTRFATSRPSRSGPFDCPGRTTSFQTNIVGTYNLLQLARERQDRIRLFHHVSTDEVFGASARPAISTEETPTGLTARFRRPRRHRTIWSAPTMSLRAAGDGFQLLKQLWSISVSEKRSR